MSRLIALWLIDTAVMINLCFIGFILCVFGFVLYPIKPARQFCGKQAIRVINFADDFLRREAKMIRRLLCWLGWSN